MPVPCSWVRARLTDFEGAQLGASGQQLNSDLAELMVSFALLVGPQRVIDTAVAQLGSETLSEALPYVQSAAITPPVRDALRHQKFDLDGFREEIARSTATELPEVAQLRRVSVGRLLLMALLVVAGYTLIAQLADIGFDTLWDVLSDAKIGWVIVAILIASVDLVTDALCMKAVVAVPIPLGPTTVKWAIKFINISVPSSGGKIAMNIRYLQRQGADAAAR
jgi:hypothetical protein